MMLMQPRGGRTAIAVGVVGALPTRRTRAVAWSVLACVVGVGAGAHVRVWLPGTDVPMTLQSLAVLLCGFYLTPRVAVFGMVTYLAVGTAGLPVFAPGSSGLAGGTGGYLVGFAVGAWLVATLKGGARAGVLRLAGAGAAGTAAIFACGLLWRAAGAALFGGDMMVAVATGIVPFAAKAVIQLGVAVSLVLSIRGLPRMGGGRRSENR